MGERGEEALHLDSGENPGPQRQARNEKTSVV